MRLPRCVKYVLIVHVLCSEYLKRDDQSLVYRLQNEETRNKMTKDAKDRDRALAQSSRSDLQVQEPEAELDDENAESAGGNMSGQGALGSDVIVIHPGSQNLRI